MPYNESVINSKILANHFQEICDEFLPPHKEENVCMNFKKFEISNKVLYFLSRLRKLIEEKKCDCETFKTDVIKSKTLSLELLWYLETAEITTFTDYFEYHENNNNVDVKNRISQEIFDSLLEIKNSTIKRHLMCDCINALFCDFKNVRESNETVKAVFNLIFADLVSNMCDETGKICIEFSSLLELLKDSNLDDTVIKTFCFNILDLLLDGKVENLKFVFKKQEKLKNSVKNTKIYKILSSMAQFCNVKDFFDCFKNQAFSNIDTINWDTVFVLITFLGTYFNEGWSLLKALCNDAIKESFQNFNVKHLAFGFIISRQGCFERPNNIFSTYLQWFSSTFSSESRRPINTKKICYFFFHFLTDLVSFDPAYYSKVHINRTPWVPPDCQSLLSDYISLVKTQLNDLNVSTELGICENTTGKSAAVFDVENVLRHFEKNGEILGSVFQAAMFWKEYYEKKFLVELLSKFDGKKSTRHKFIMKLHSVGKIPNSMYKNYKSLEKK